MSVEAIIYSKDFSWNSEHYSGIPVPDCIPSEPTISDVQRMELVAEDLRDGLHGVERYPTAEQMIPYLHKLNHFGINRATVGIYPGESFVVDETIKSLLKEMRQELPNMTPIVLCMTTQDSLDWTKACKDINPNLEALIFMGTAPMRRLVQGWTLDKILERLGNSTAEAVKAGIPVIGATEHTTQTPPHELKEIIKVQVLNGASSFCIADTIGIARPGGAHRITKFVKNTLMELGTPQLPIEWHGHRDLGNDVGNAMVALASGASRIHTVARGVGERAGNTQLEAIVLNIQQIYADHGMEPPWDMHSLLNLLHEYENINDIPVPTHGPLAQRFGTTSVGIHADAIHKIHILIEEAQNNDDPRAVEIFDKMARTIYSAVDPEMVGGEVDIRVGPWSGHKNVFMACRLLGGDPNSLTPETVEKVLHTARLYGRQLSTKELKDLLDAQD